MLTLLVCGMLSTVMTLFVLSLTLAVLTLGGCPLIWASKLQSKISLSTTEAEYIVPS